MVFSSNVFLFLFLPIFLGLYYLSGNRYRNLLILIGSYVFYAWWRVDFLLLFVAVTLFLPKGIVGAVAPLMARRRAVRRTTQTGPAAPVALRATSTSTA